MAFLFANKDVPVAKRIISIITMLGIFGTIVLFVLVDEREGLLMLVGCIVALVSMMSKDLFGDEDKNKQLITLIEHLKMDKSIVDVMSKIRDIEEQASNK